MSANLHNLLQYPMGFKWWKSSFPSQIPRFEVYKCLGLDTRTGYYLFVNQRNKSKFACNINQIQRNGLTPFLYVNENFVEPSRGV